MHVNKLDDIVNKCNNAHRTFKLRQVHILTMRLEIVIKIINLKFVIMLEFQKKKFFFFLYLGFLSRTFRIHGTAGEGGGYLFNSSLPLPPASQTLRH